MNELVVAFWMMRDTSVQMSTLVIQTTLRPIAVHVGGAILAHPSPNSLIPGHRQRTSLVEIRGRTQTNLPSHLKKGVETIYACFSKPLNFRK